MGYENLVQRELMGYSKGMTTTGISIRNIIHTTADKAAEIARLTELADRFAAQGHTASAELARSRRSEIEATTPTEEIAAPRVNYVDLMH
jgi:hypothetical protein